MSGFFGIFDPIRKLEREHQILELKVKNAKLRRELKALEQEGDE